MNKTKIEIKGLFTDWKEVDKEQAKSFVKHFMASIVTTSDIDKKIAMVEGKHLQGITVRELLGIKKEA